MNLIMKKITYNESEFESYNESENEAETNLQLQKFQ